MNLTGMHAATGRSLSGIEHLSQSIRDILTTPAGSRVMRRDYGSQIPELIDQPMNGATLLRLAAASYLALARWEPRLVLSRIRFAPDPTAAGRLTVELQGRLTEAAGQDVVLTLPLTGS